MSVVPAKLLLDENISPKVAEKLAREDGIDACHVRDRGLLATTDREVLVCAFNEDRVLVTSKEVLTAYGIEAKHPDEFIIDQIGLAPGAVVNVVVEQAQSLKNPPRMVPELLDDSACTAPLTTPGR